MKALMIIQQIFNIAIFTCIGIINTHAQIVDGGNGHAIVLDSLGQVWTIGRMIMAN